jgi:hypothetical protein
VGKGFWLRLFTGSVDGVIGLVVALLLSNSTGVFFAHRAVVMLEIGSPNTLWQGPIPMVLGIMGTLVYGLPFAMLLVFLPEALSGATPGKCLLRIRVKGREDSPATKWRLWLRYLLKTCGLWGMTLALLAGSWELAIIAAVAQIVVLLGFLLCFGTNSLALHDRISGTVVSSYHMHRPGSCSNDSPPAV